MKTRNHNWFNSKTKQPQFGFQVLVGQRWCHAMEDGKILLFDTEAERDEKKAEFRKMKEKADA